MPKPKLPPEDRAILRAIAVLDNIDYWKPEFVQEVLKDLEIQAFRRCLKGYFEYNAAGGKRVRLDFDSEPTLKE